MNLINDYFNFKKKNLIHYATVFVDNKENTLEYLGKFIDTYIDTCYYHILTTYYDETVNKFNGKIIIKELKGKKLEIVDELDAEHKNDLSLVDRCYKYSFIAVIIDRIHFDNVTRVDEFKTILKNILVDEKKLIKEDNVILNKLATLVKDAVLKERKLFSSLTNENFKVQFYRYKNSKTYNKVSLDYTIELLSKSYNVDVVDKIYKGDKIKLLKFETLMNLLSLEMLNKLLKEEVIDYYFVDVPIGEIKDRKEFERYVHFFDNNRLKNNIVFVIHYNEYIQNKSMFKNLNEFTFAICIDLTRTIVIDKRLAEIESFELFHYVIIDGVKKENLPLVENYVIKGKVMFMNELSIV